MKILLVGMNFYNYEKKIKSELEKYSDVVDLISDSPANYHLIKRIFGKKVSDFACILYQNILIKKLSKNYDFLIVIVGRKLSRGFLQKFRFLNPRCTLVLYLWDDIARVENYNKVFDLYDKKYSFDMNDCENYGLNFLPLFYTEKDSAYKRNKKYDLYSTMALHSDRLKLMKEIAEQAQKIDRKVLLFAMVGHLEYMLYRIKRKYDKDNENIIYVPKALSQTKNYEYMRSAKAILDIQFPSQNGLTMRTIEALGCGVKIITTNTNIKKYDFYHADNIQIIDREDIKIDWDFLDKDYFEIPKEIYEKYSLNSWVKTILNIDEK